MKFNKKICEVRLTMWLEFSDSIMDTAVPQKFPFILDKNLVKANCTENKRNKKMH